MKTIQFCKNSLRILLCLLLLTATAYAADYPAAGDFQKGAKTWAENCGRCHNIRGAKELRDDQWITTVFHMRVRAGLTGQEARDVLTFLQGSNSPTPVTQKGAKATEVALASKSGKTIYTQTCVACHGVDGRGSLPGVPDFLSGDSPLNKSDDVLLDNITNGFQSPGSPMAMPPKGGNPDLTRADMEAVLDYLNQSFRK